MKTSRSLSPFKDVFDPLKDYQNFFRGFNLPEMSGWKSDYDFNPVCEVSENKESYCLRMEVPGVEKDDIQIEMQDTQLVIRGEKKEEKRLQGDKQHFSESFYGSFFRSFSLPLPVNADRIEAKLVDGVLKVTVPKDETKSSSHQVKIQ